MLLGMLRFGVGAIYVFWVQRTIVAHVRRGGSEPGAAPEVHSDYAFLRNRRGDHSSVPAVCSTERRTGSAAAHVVPSKGAGGGWIVQQYSVSVAYEAKLY